MPVKIPEALVRRLREADLSTRRFLKLDGKAAVEKDWPERLYEPEELARIWRGNYGVAAGEALVLIDGDKDPLLGWLADHLPRTFKVLSPGSRAPHYYLKLEGGNIENLTLSWGVDEKGQPINVGHVQASRKYLVGPGSIHPEGGVYTIIDDAPIATIEAERLLEVVAPFTKDHQDQVHEAAALEKRQTNVDIPILQVVPLTGLRKQGDEYYGAHPIHGSKTERNFWVNPTKNVWHCFRHGSGGGPLLWLAVEEGIIRCEDAGPGALRGDLFKQVLQKARERGVIKQAKVNLKQRQEGIPVGNYILKLVGSKAVFCDGNDQPKLSYPAERIDGLRTKQTIAKKLGVDEEVVDQAIARFVCVLEQPKPIGATKPTQPPTELVEKARRLLKDPKLILYIIQALRQQGLVGETRNALSTFHDMLTAKTSWPINRRWSGRSGMGKSTIAMKVAELFPPEMVMVLSGATKKTLWYHPDAEQVDEYTRQMNLEGKIIIMLEESESKEFLDEIKPLLSHDKHELEYAFVEKVGNGNVTHKMKLRGWPVYIGITTEAELREEQQTRALLGTPDYGKDKYRAVIAADAEKAAKPWAVEKTDLPQVIQEAIRQLKPCKVWIPWLPIVAALFPHEEPKSMREWLFFRSFLEAIAILHQQQIPRVKVKGVEYHVAPLTVLEIASKIGEAGFEETLSKLPRDVREFCNHLAAQSNKTWTYRELQKEYGKCFGGSIGWTTIKKRYVEKLVDEGLLEIDGSQKPYKIKLAEERSTSFTILEKALKISRNDEIMRELVQKTFCSREGDTHVLEVVNSDGDPLSLDELIYILTHSRLEQDVERAISRPKSEEYALPSLFSKLVKDVDDSGEKNQKAKNMEPRVNLTLKPEDVTKLERLTSNVQGKCVQCGQSGRMDWQATKHNGSWVLLCGDCGRQLESQIGGEIES